MSRLRVCAGVKPRWESRARVLLALAALLGQVWIATPHVTRELVSALAPFTQRAAIAPPDVTARAQYAAHHHDPSRCPICQASAIARSGVTSSADAGPVGVLSPTFDVVDFDYDRVASAPADPKATPRAPPT